MAAYNYVTLFNINYLNRGLVMYHSLKKVSTDVTLYVVCFDDPTYFILKELNYPDLVPISLNQFEDEELLAVKPGRTATEYCWTCSSAVIWYCINSFHLKNCAYIDADMYFYSDPQVIWNENQEASVYITLHNYSEKYDQSKESGRFCVQFVGFKNTPDGMAVLKEWRDNCITWCYNRIEDGKFGDQKYLDAWPNIYKSVYVVKNMTAGLAPWNVQQFEIKNEQWVIKKSNKLGLVPVFFHFHKLKIYENATVSFTSSYYELEKNVLHYFYHPYAKKLLEMDAFLKDRFNEMYPVKYTQSEVQPLTFLNWLKYYAYDIKNNIRNLNARFTNSRFHNDYTYKIDL